jgi:hypothetical protein
MTLPTDSGKIRSCYTLGLTLSALTLAAISPQRHLSQHGQKYLPSPPPPILLFFPLWSGLSDLDLEGLDSDDDLHLGEEGEDEGGEEDSAHQPCTPPQSSGIVCSIG